MSTDLAARNEQSVALPADSIMSGIMRAASDPKIDVSKLQALLDMQRTLRQEQSEQAFSVAMRSAQEEMRPVVRDASNSHTQSKYARLETIDAEVRPIYTRHGFSLTFNAGSVSGDSITVSCSVMHDQGHTKYYSLPGGIDSAGAKGASNKTPIQGLGSTVSYLRRYLTCMIFNIVLANEDTDGRRPDPSYITEQQQDQILTMFSAIDGVGGGGRFGPERREKFFDWLGVEGLPKLTKGKFHSAMTFLQQAFNQEQKKA